MQPDRKHRQKGNAEDRQRIKNQDEIRKRSEMQSRHVQNLAVNGRVNRVYIGWAKQGNEEQL